uniref:NADH-quinone oxidoreductase subunit C n=1 Tax=Candidatus Kentrum eta TaxID=2126337 RepID=A0A450VBP3_9GAMM|nr:MAG: NADH dehydrogenase subunit C [Candidatus Kentron sp. H]VFJ96171.1 MAG: NADH dehydrogenase subunit C [Candidatus Kentron sp. H]VFK02193.1 MAG: NADH dehydrogenase subunit C [Candidatus Kentron sp. H]
METISNNLPKTFSPRVLMESLQKRFSNELMSCDIFAGDVTLEIPARHLLAVCRALRNESPFGFGQLVDLCGVDYGQYGIVNWEADTGSGSFSRGVIFDTPSASARVKDTEKQEKQQFAVIYHLLSHSNNQRLRVRTYALGDPPRVDSVTEVWNSVDWFEREAFDLFGILFEGHPDLRRILTDYGFIGHPLRKDFPLTGTVQARYDPEKKRVAYEPVSIKPRTLVPRVIR